MDNIIAWLYEEYIDGKLVSSHITRFKPKTITFPKEKLEKVKIEVTELVAGKKSIYMNQLTIEGFGDEDE